MFFPWHDPAVRLTGRWTRLENVCRNPNRFHQLTEQYTLTSAPGSYFEVAFVGYMIVLQFDLGLMSQPLPHLWISIDGGARFEVPLDRYLRVQAADDGCHVVRVVYKGAMEHPSRWYFPLLSGVCFVGAHADAPGVLPEDNRRIIEFIGDSITEGVLVDDDFAAEKPEPHFQRNRPYEDDNCATYAALTAQALNLRPVFQAYGAVGLTRSGCGGVPRAGQIYPYVCDGVPYVGEKPDIIVINHGANDRFNSTQEYRTRYLELLALIRQRNPRAAIICLSPFCGAFDQEVKELVADYNQKEQDNVHFISSKGWLPAEPLHPLREGHKIVAEHLIPLLKCCLCE